MIVQEFKRLGPSAYKPEFAALCGQEFAVKGGGKDGTMYNGMKTVELMLPDRTDAERFPESTLETVSSFQLSDRQVCAQRELMMSLASSKELPKDFNPRLHVRVRGEVLDHAIPTLM